MLSSSAGRPHLLLLLAAEMQGRVKSGEQESSFSLSRLRAFHRHYFGPAGDVVKLPRSPFLGFKGLPSRKQVTGERLIVLPATAVAHYFRTAGRLHTATAGVCSASN